MRFAFMTTLCALNMAACDIGPTAIVSDGFCGARDMTSTSGDMSQSTGTCAAAKGLSGTNLVCADFNAVTSLTDQKLARWDFTTNCGSNLEINAGKLQIKNFAGFMGSCSFLLPALNLTDADKQKYQSYTLSVVHSLDINKQKQSSGIYLGLAVDTQQIWSSTSTNSRQVTTIKIDKAVLPNGGGTSYQPLFSVISNIMSPGYQGWQIDSIAVNASP